MSDITQFNPDDLIRQRMEYATEEHAKLLVVNADLRARIEKLEGLLDTWQVQYENGRSLSFVNEETAKALEEKPDD